MRCYGLSPSLAIVLALAGCDGQAAEPQREAIGPTSGAPAPLPTAGDSTVADPIPDQPPATRGPDAGMPDGQAMPDAGASDDAQTPAGDDPESQQALAALRAYLDTPAAQRPPIEDQGFGATPLTRADAATARAWLWDDYAGA
jgi:hypothetical protein